MRRAEARERHVGSFACMSRPSLPADTSIGAVHLRVKDLDRLVAFYHEILGFAVLGEDGATAALGPDGGPRLLTLQAVPGAPKPPEPSTGLFHVAFEVPSRAALGAMLIRVRQLGYAFSGFADHHVSEALYLSDPEGNGIELYSDRLAKDWQWEDGEIFMTTDPLDVVGLLQDGRAAAPRLPRGTKVGHVHLKVSTLAAAEAFYVGQLGFDVTARRLPGALFVSAGGYHHHLGLNVWSGEGAPRPPMGSRGLAGITLVVPDVEARRLLLGGAEHGELVDPDEVLVRVDAGS
jgi:catechol 2,3-dioxygenase